jgi:PTH2 family peptidyl-tRNA hydrolase
MSVNSVKQVIVVRKDLNMRKGKMIAQGSHASIAALMLKVFGPRESRPGLKDNDVKIELDGIFLDPAEQAWYFGNFRKICCYVESEQALLDIELAAKARGLRCHLIEDRGLTEFNGVPTKTCLAIGPHWDHEIDPVTGQLPLL